MSGKVNLVGPGFRRRASRLSFVTVQETGMLVPSAADDGADVAVTARSG